METLHTKVRQTELQPATIMGWFTAPVLDKNGEVKTPSQRVKVLNLDTCVHTAENDNIFIKGIAVPGHHSPEIVGRLKHRKVVIFRGELEDFEGFLADKAGAQVLLDTQDWDTKKTKKDDISDLDDLANQA